MTMKNLKRKMTLPALAKTIVIWKELGDGQFFISNEELLEQIVYPVYKITNANDPKSRESLMSDQITKKKMKEIGRINSSIISLKFNRVSIRGNFALAQSTAFDGEKEFEIWYMLLKEEQKYKIYNCNVKRILSEI